MQEHGVFVHDLILNAVNKIVGVDLGCWALSVGPHFQALQSFFNLWTHSGVQIFSQRRNTNSFIVNQKAPHKN